MIHDYVNYFRNIAIKHKQINHAHGAEIGSYTLKENRHFAIFEHDEVVTGLRSQIADGIVLFLHLYDTKGYDNLADDYRATHTGAFIIAEKAPIEFQTRGAIAYSSLDGPEVLQSYETCETIMWQIINRMMMDSRDPCHLFHRIQLSDFTIDPVSNLWDGRYGWYVQFTFQTRRNDVINNALATDPPIWTP